MDSQARRSSNWGVLLLTGALLATGLPKPLQAAVITYKEVIDDTRDPFVFFDVFRDLERTRTLGDGSPPLVELDDTVIVAENAISDSFGRWRAEPVTYSHVFQPVAPVLQFEMASLQIAAASVSGTPSEGFPPDFFEFLFGLGTPDDPVVVEGNFLGYLNPAFPFAETEIEFSSGESALLGLLLADDRLDVTITPMGPGFIFEPDGDKIAVRSSTLSVTYKAPEPTSMALLIAGGAIGLLVRRRTKSRRA